MSHREQVERALSAWRAAERAASSAPVDSAERERLEREADLRHRAYLAVVARREAAERQHALGAVAERTAVRIDAGRRRGTAAVAAIRDAMGEELIAVAEASTPIPVARPATGDLEADGVERTEEGGRERSA